MIYQWTTFKVWSDLLKIHSPNLEFLKLLSMRSHWCKIIRIFISLRAIPDIVWFHLDRVICSVCATILVRVHLWCRLWPHHQRSVRWLFCVALCVRIHASLQNRSNPMPSSKWTNVSCQMAPTCLSPYCDLFNLQTVLPGEFKMRNVALSWGL